MDTYSNTIYSQRLYEDLQFVEKLLSFSNGVQREFSDNPITPQVEFNINSQSGMHLNSQDAHLNDKIIETQSFSKADSFVQNLNHLLLKQPATNIDQNKERIKDEIKTFPNFIVRSFANYLENYRHLYSKKDGLQNLLNYLGRLCGAKHYTLQHLHDLFQDNSHWNSRINRGVLHHILNKHSYADIFNNGQRKKKKTYLIMTKVYKLRTKIANLCSRVQCQ